MDVFEKLSKPMRPIKTSGAKLPDGRIIFIREVDFDIGSESWSRYYLKDGGEVRLRVAVTKISECLVQDPTQPDELGPDGIPLHLTTALNEQGDPMFYVASQNLVVASV